MIKVFKNSTDLSIDASSYTRDFFALTLLASDKLYVGHRKPINALFSGLETPNSNTSILSIKFWNGTAFTAVSGLEDTSKGFTRSGFFNWNRNQTNEAATTINSLEMFWYEITVDADTSAMNVKGLNLLFSDDSMILESEPQLTNGDFYLSGLNDHMPFHQSSKTEIIQRLRNEGHKIFSDKRYNLDIFDLNDFKELSSASTMLALSKIFFNISDGPDDKYYQKHMDYRGLYENAYNTFFLSLDKNDDGKEDVAENNETVTTGQFLRY